MIKSESSKRNTGFKDRRGIPIHEGDLVITRERHPWFRKISFDYGHRLPWWFHRWFIGLGRRNGRPWLGVVEEWGDECNPPRWIFRSVNMGATIHGYWASEMEVVYLPPDERDGPFLAGTDRNVV